MLHLFRDAHFGLCEVLPHPLLALLLLATPAAAQTVDPAAIPEGGQVIYHLATGAPLATSTFRDLDQPLYTVEYRKGDRLEGPPDEVHLYNPDGNMVIRRFADGSEMTYDPHSCVRTIGTCDYTLIFPSGATRAYRRENTWTQGGMMRSRLIKLDDPDAPTLIDTRYLAFSDDGLVQRGEVRADSGRVTWAREATRLWVDPQQ